MAVLQATILESLSAGQNGFVAASTAGLGETLVRQADANIGSGLFVCEGATPGKTSKAPTTAAEAKASLGVLINPEYLNEIGVSDYLAGDGVTILQHGYIWINVEGTVAHDGKVFVRHTSDGADNTTLGKARGDSDYPAGGITLTPAAPTASVSNTYSVTLYNGVVREEYVFTSDATPTVAEIITGLAAKINAGTAFDAVDGTTVLNVTSVNGILEIETSSNFAQSTPARAALLKGARFHKGRTGAGLVKVKLQLRQDF